MDFSSLLNSQGLSQPPPASKEGSNAALPASMSSVPFDFLAQPAAPPTAYDPSATAFGLPNPVAPLAGGEMASFPSPLQGDANLDLAAEQAAGAAMASLYSSLGGFGGGALGGGMDALVDPALAALAAPPPVQPQLASANPADLLLPSQVAGGVAPTQLLASQGVSPASVESFVPDSDDGDGGGTAQSLPTGDTVKREEEEMDVDVMGGADDGASLAALKAQASSSGSTSKPKPKSSSSKPKSRASPAHFASGGTSPAPSPGPSSSLANEILPSASTSNSPPSTSTAILPTTAPAESIHPSFQHSGPPSAFIHPRLRDRTNLASSLPAAFAAYRPPKSGKANDDSDEDGDDETRRRERARRAAQAAAQARGKRRRGQEEDDDDEEKDDRLYCVCRELYDPERLMIACDKCEEWYHVDCVGIAEDAVELVDLFICPKCQATSLDRTTWKSPCQRPHCRAPAVPLSKYCSDYCGVYVASSRLALLQIATSVAPEAFYPSVRSATRKDSAVTDQQAEGADARLFLSMEARRAKQAAEWAREDAAFERTRAGLVARLAETEQRQSRLRDRVRLAELRVAYLRVAVKRWEALCQATADEMQQAGIDLDQAVAAGGGRKRDRRSKKKGPVAATSLPDAQCGLDVRLVYDEQQWAAWVADGGPEGGRTILEAQEGGEEEKVAAMALEMLGGVCLETRKRCERHQGWQKVREADFQVEKAVLQRRLDRLATTSHTLSDQLAAHDSTVTVRRSVRARVATLDPDRLIDVDEYIGEREQGRVPNRRLSGASGGGTGRGAEGSPELGDDGRGEGSPELGAGGGARGDEPYEIPPEVLPFLSRAEIAAMRRRGGR
ncbi:hypothetical protein JCM8097_004370 [Rhodosporidiobolus ruineniae]